MQQSYQIFSGNRALSLTPNNPEAYRETPLTDAEQHLLETEVQQALQQFVSGKTDIDIAVADTTYALGVLQRSYDQFIRAAGGVVFSPGAKLLVIRRLGLWDLPKGKIDPGETDEQAAIREVEEETGLTTVKLGDWLCNTYHTYDLKGKSVLKESVWYNMTAEEETLVPQTEESITEAKWFFDEQIDEVYSDTYPNIRKVLQQVYPKKFAK